MAPLSLLFLTTIIIINLSGASAAPQPEDYGHLFFPLTHSFSRSHNSTTHHLLKTATLRSTARHHARRTNNKRQQSEVSLPLSLGTDYTLSLSVGRTSVDLYMDTGSDLVWFPCAPFECILCDGKTPVAPPPPPPPPTSSHPVTCDSPSCSAAHSSLPSSDLCAAAGCPLDAIETSNCSTPCPAFYYAYGDGSLIANLRRGPLSLPSTAPIRLPTFHFACAHTALAEPVGVAGFGGGLLSLPAQLAARRFSYCLVAHAFTADRLLRPSPLVLGRGPRTMTSPGPEFTYTPMLRNPKHPYFYSVGLEAISVGPARIPAGHGLSTVDRAGNGGMVVDSGTTFTMLPAGLHARLAGEFGRLMKAAGFTRAGLVEDETGLGSCYWLATSRGKTDTRRVPGMALHFAGNATVTLPRRNYFLGFEREKQRVGCLMVMSEGEMAAADGGGEGPAGTLGNYQQQGFEVVYDLEERQVGFARRPCAAMWDSLSKG